MRGSTIAVRSLRSGLPLRHLRRRLRRLLQIPSGLSTPRASHATATPGSNNCNFPASGEGRVLEVLAAGGGWVEHLAGPAPGRPRGRPLGAYAGSCVVVMALSRVAALLVCFCAALRVWKVLRGCFCRLPGQPTEAFGCLAVCDAAARLRGICFAGLASSRPRRRPFEAFTVSCVVVMALSRPRHAHASHRHMNSNAARTAR